MGRFSVEFEVANFRDLIQAEAGALPAEQVRRVTISGVVDTGASKLVLPGSVVALLGLAESGTIGVKYADGRREVRPIVNAVHVRIGDRASVMDAVVEPGRSDALIGAFVLEQLDLLPDCTAGKLVPRDPGGMLAEIE